DQAVAHIRRQRVADLGPVQGDPRHAATPFEQQLVAHRREPTIRAMDLSLSPDELAFRDDVRVWLVDNLPEGWGLTGYREPQSFEEKLGFAKGWERTLADAGWAGISWPKEYGGRGATLMEQVIFHQEM